MLSSLRRPAVALITTTLAASVLGIAPAAHAAASTISGEVTGPLGTGLSGVEVTVYEYEPLGQYWEPTYFADTVDGSYTVDVPAGEYTVGFRDWTGDHAPEYYDDAPIVSQAKVLTVGADNLTVSAQLAEAAHITGHVTLPEGLADRRVTVSAHRRVEEDDGSPYFVQTPMSALVNPDGSYDIAGLAAGTYRVKFADKYLTHGIAVEYYDDQASIWGADTEDLVLDAGQVLPDIDAVLAGESRITGTVTNSANQPFTDDAWVQAFTRSGGEWAPVDGTMVSEDGTYVLDALPAGTYRLAFYGYTAGADITEYWDNAGSIEAADDIVLREDEVASGRDAKLVSGEHDPVLDPYFEALSAPTISGPAQVGATLTATTGTFAPAPSGIEYAWYRNGEWIEGATSSSYVPTAADLGKQLTVQTAASGEGYERTYSDVSAPTAPVVAAPVVVPPAPVVTPPAPVVGPAPVVTAPAALAAILEGVDVTGKPKVGAKLKLSGLDKLFRASTPVSYKFRWFAGKKAVKKGTRSTLKVTRAMKGEKISVKVTAKAGSATKSIKLKVGKVR